MVLGYTQNESRRFYTYVANRVQIIRQAFDPTQWKYIETADNPTDLATRSITPKQLIDSQWLKRPEFRDSERSPQSLTSNMYCPSSTVVTCNTPYNENPTTTLPTWRICFPRPLFPSILAKSQYLADQFWIRWKHEYLQALQSRSKWNDHPPNLEVRDIVIVKDQTPPNHWPMGKVVDAIKSKDDKVRKAEVALWKDGGIKKYLRPINELVQLIRSKTPKGMYFM